MRNKYLIAIFCGVFGLALVLGGCSGKNQPTIAPVEGGRAPDFVGKDLTNQTVALNDLLEDNLVLTFWRTDSPPSRRELSTINELQAEQGDDLNILTINVNEDKANVEIYLKNNKINLPVLLDGEKASIASMYRIDYIPTTFIIDEDGIILKKVNGGISKAEIVKILKLK